jgi:ADP-ribose pyrophosphatase YjhB (NUDIX family)
MTNNKKPSLGVYKSPNGKVFSKPEEITNMLNSIVNKQDPVKYENPFPVAIALIPVICSKPNSSNVKLLAVRRNIEPKIGAIALPGGYQEIESVSDATIREVKEETNIDITLKSEEALVLSTPDNKRILMFFVANNLNEKDVNLEFTNQETQELVLIDSSTKLAFPLHKKAVQWFYAKLNKGE